MVERKHPEAACEVCPLACRPYVPSVLPDKPVIALIGDAPGIQEVRQNTPFTGPSGALLDKMLEHYNVNPDQAARLNVVCCQPEALTAPDAKAIACCSRRLATELLTLDKQLPVVTLGNTATQALDKLAGRVEPEGITKRRGTFYPLGKERRYLATLDPSYVLRNPTQSRVLLDDINKAIYKPAAKDWLKTQYLVLTAGNWHVKKMYLERVPSGALVSFDTETTGLQWWHTHYKPADTLLCVVIAVSVDKAVIIPAETLEDEAKRKWLADWCKNKRIIAHNGKFDEFVSLSRLQYPIHVIEDTMLASFALNEIKGFNGLKYLAAARLDVPDYEDELITKHFEGVAKRNRNYGVIPKEDLYLYAAIDACATLALWPILKHEMIEDGVKGAYDLMMHGHRVTTAAGYRGFKIDRQYLLSLGDVLEERKHALTMQMWSLLEENIEITRYSTPKKLTAPYSKETKNSKPFNPGSDTQMSYLLYDYFKLEHIKQLGYKTKPDSTNEEALKALPPHIFVKALLEYRTVAKLISTYVEKLLTLADVNDRVHINFNLNGTETGRLSADDSLHGVPRPEDFYGMAIRGSFIAEEGKVLILGDYSQAELRVIAAESGERFFLDAFNMSEEDKLAAAEQQYAAIFAEATPDVQKALAKLATDVHSKAAKVLFEDYEASELDYILLHDIVAAGIAKKYRTFGKNFNFGTVYQGGPSGIWAMTGGAMPLAVIKELQKVYRDNTPALTQYCIDQFRRAKTTGFVQTRTGRKRRFTLLTYDNLDEAKKASVNMPVQGAASDLTLLSAAELEQLSVPVVHIIHDMIICEVDIAKAQSAAALMHHVMIHTAATYFPEVEWAVDIEISPRWFNERPDLSKYDPSAPVVL